MAAKGWETEKIFMGVLKAVWSLVPERPTEGEWSGRQVLAAKILIQSESQLSQTQCWD